MFLPCWIVTDRRQYDRGFNPNSGFQSSDWYGAASVPARECNEGEIYFSDGARPKLSGFPLYLWFCMLMLQCHKEAEAAGHFVRFHNQNQSETQKGNRNMRFTQY